MGAPLLITGFGPFEGVEHNPSGELARLLGQRPDCRGCELPVTFCGAPEVLDQELMDLGQPPLGILSLGVHPGQGFRLEQQARGTLLGDRPDNEGITVSSLGLEGEVLSTSLDLEALEAALRGAGARQVEQSQDAGAYVCERVYFCSLQRGRDLGVVVLFLHVPPAKILGVESQLPLVSALVDEFMRQARS